MDKAEAIIAALGGAANIRDLEPCATRLRTEVGDVSLVDQAGLKAAGAYGVMVAGNNVQVVVGTEADNIASDIEELIE